MKSIIIDESDNGRRLDKFLLEYFPAAGYGFLQKMLRKKNITLNGKKTGGSTPIKSGDEIQVFFSDETFMNLKDVSGVEGEYNEIKNMDFSDHLIVKETDELLIINKPYGILSQKSNPNDISVNELARAYMIKNGYTIEEYGHFKPSVINRLDRNTAGLIMVAKTKESAVKYTRLIKDKKIKKYYMLLVQGRFLQDGIHTAMYRKNEKKNMAEIRDEKSVEGYKDWKQIKTGFKCVEYKGGYSLVEALLFTGKSHQIRAHMAYLGYPLVGDVKYGAKAFEGGINGQYLFAYKLDFADGNIVSVDLPKFFRKPMEKM